MQPTRQPTPVRVQHEGSNPLRNPLATPPAPLRPLPSAPCPHCCGEGYLVTSGPGYFDLHEECWMPNDDIDPCPTCRGTGCQRDDWDEPERQDAGPQPKRNPDSDADDSDLPRPPLKENPMNTPNMPNSDDELQPIPDWPAQRASKPTTTREVAMPHRIDWTALYAALSEPFEPSLIRYRAGAINRDKTQAQALPYVGPRAYEDRLNQLLPGNWEVTFEPWGEQRVICRLTIHGVMRSSTGEASDSPDGIAGTSAEAQAFKRACAKFGLGRHLYDLPVQWRPYDAASRRLATVHPSCTGPTRSPDRDGVQPTDPSSAVAQVQAANREAVKRSPSNPATRQRSWR